jgi:hypothetical protein
MRPDYQPEMESCPINIRLVLFYDTVVLLDLARLIRVDHILIFTLAGLPFLPPHASDSTGTSTSRQRHGRTPSSTSNRYVLDAALR